MQCAYVPIELVVAHDARGCVSRDSYDTMQGVGEHKLAHVTGDYDQVQYSSF